ncbi:MAG: hypothetical protein ABJB12_19775 [Pseudomonadota bacterium]
MIRTRGVALGVTLALCACGKKFEATDAQAGGAPAADAGATSGGTDGSAAGESEAGSVSGGAPSAGSGGAPEQSAGSSSGGATAAGAGGLLNTGGTGGLLSTGGTGGLLNTGGVVGSAGGGMDGGETPPIPTLGLVMWLRADRGVVLNAGRVTQWLDQSGNQMDALQTAGNARPTLLATGFNGLPTLDFDGTVQYLRLPDGFADFSKGLSGFVVARARVTDGGCASMLEVSNGSEIDDIAFAHWQQAWNYEVFDHDFGGGTVDPAQPVLFSILHRTTEEVVMRLNGDQANTSMFPLPLNKLRQDNFIGHSLYADCKYYQGQISEVVLYNRTVTDKELLTIEGYLQQHWALAPM